MKNICFVILAAGKGTRMGNNILKFNQILSGKPLLYHVLSKIRPKFSYAVNIVISDHNHKKIIDSFGFYNIDYCIQKEQKGTGHALMMAQDKIISSDFTIVLYADVVIFKNTMIEKMINSVQNGNDLSIISFNDYQDNRYGKFVLDKDHNPKKIVEYKTDKMAGVTLCNSGLLIVKTDLLNDFLNQLSVDPISNEYYLTDIVEYAYKNGFKTHHIVEEKRYLQGINTKDDLLKCEKIIKEDYANKL